jgi:hypothetical protein
MDVDASRRMSLLEPVEHAESLACMKVKDYAFVKYLREVKHDCI